MHKLHLASAVLATTFAAACSDSATAPSALASRDAPALSKAPSPPATRQFRLTPGTFNPDGIRGIVAEWRKYQGEIDRTGNKFYALYLAKKAPTSANAAAGADIEGVAGMRPAELLVLAWDHRVGTHCGAGAPRWDIYLRDEVTNKDYVVFLGCMAAAHTTGIPGVSPYPRPGSVWLRDTWDAARIQAAVAAAALAAGASPATSVVRFLQIIFDEGTDQGVGFVYLDNIQVNQQIWTSPRDNPKGKGKNDKDSDDKDSDDHHDDDSDDHHD